MNMSGIYLDALTRSSSNNMHIAIGKLGKETHMKIFPKEAYRSELAPKEAKTKEVAINGTSYILMSYY